MDFKKIQGAAAAAAVGMVLGATSVYAGKILWPGHKHLQRGENMLVNAKAALEKATHDCGGHRVKAVELIDQALGEVREARKWANEHPEQLK